MATTGSQRMARRHRPAAAVSNKNPFSFLVPVPYSLLLGILGVRGRKLLLVGDGAVGDRVVLAEAQRRVRQAEHLERAVRQLARGLAAAAQEVVEEPLRVERQPDEDVPLL